MEESLWTSWAKKAAGEWEGRQRLFDGSGSTISVPEWLVPDEYLQWGVAVNDMMTQMSVRTTDLGQIETARFKIFRQVPRAGCQEDFVQVHSKQTFDLSLRAGAHLFDDGSYVCDIENIANEMNSTIAGPFKIDRESAAQLKAAELCLVCENYDDSQSHFIKAGHRKRIRVTCVWSGTDLAYIIYCFEQWASDCNDGQSLVSCASIAGIPSLSDPSAKNLTDADEAQWKTIINGACGSSSNQLSSRGDSCISLPNNALLKVNSQGCSVQLIWETCPGHRRVLQVDFNSENDNQKASILATQDMV